MDKQLSILQRLVLQRERFYSLRAWQYLNHRFFFAKRFRGIGLLTLGFLMHRLQPIIFF